MINISPLHIKIPNLETAQENVEHLNEEICFDSTIGLSTKVEDFIGDAGAISSKTDIVSCSEQGGEHKHVMADRIFYLAMSAGINTPLLSSVRVIKRPLIKAVGACQKATLRRHDHCSSDTVFSSLEEDSFDDLFSIHKVDQL